MMMIKKTVSLPDELAESVATAAKRAGVSKSQLIREAIAVHVATIEQQDLTLIGSVSVESVQGADTEDWLLENWGRHLKDEFNSFSRPDLGDKSAR